MASQLDMAESEKEKIWAKLKSLCIVQSVMFRLKVGVATHSDCRLLNDLPRVRRGGVGMR